MKTSTIAVIVVIILAFVGLGYWYYVQAPTVPAPAGQTQEEGTPAVDDTPDSGINVGVDAEVSVAPMGATVAYGANGFSPSQVTIKKGGTVTWSNQGSGNMWVGADEHPTHMEYDGTGRTTHCVQGYTGAKPFDQCGATASYSFTFTKTGTFDYHNHSGANHTGSVVVVD